MIQVGGGRDDTTTLENATYLGGVAVSEAGPSEGQYLQVVTDPGQGQAGGLVRCKAAGRRPGPARGRCKAWSGAGTAGPRPNLLPTLQRRV